MKAKQIGLRAKLVAAIAGLATITLLVIAVALYTTFRWQAANVHLETHFQRSLLLQNVRANTFQALKEVDDGLTSDHVDARADFEAALAPAHRDFASWAALAETSAERDEVSRVRAAFSRLIGSGRRVFDLLPVDRQAAIRLADDKVDTKDLAQFRAITTAAVEADLSIRKRIAIDTRRLRETAQVMLAISAVSAIALMLLIAAFLTSDLFRPLRSIAAVLERVGKGERHVRADTARGDEIGDIARALNRVLDRLDEALASPVVQGGRESPTGRIAQALHARIIALRTTASERDWAAAESLSAALAAEAPGSTEGDRRPINLLDLLNTAVAQHGAEIRRRGISVEQRLPAPMPKAVGYEEAVASALAAMMSRALDRLPDRGGNLALRTYVDPDSGATQIEISDNGKAPEEPDDPTIEAIEIAAGRSGGRARIFNDPQRGSVAQLTLA